MNILVINYEYPPIGGEAGFYARTSPRESPPRDTGSRWSPPITDPCKKVNVSME